MIVAGLDMVAGPTDTAEEIRARHVHNVVPRTNHYDRITGLSFVLFQVSFGFAYCFY